MQRKEILQNHAGSIEARIAELNDCLSLVRQKVKYYNQWLASGKRPFHPPDGKKSKQASKQAEGDPEPFSK
ncbi:MAG: hypothetical protein K8S54_03135 [Spirochaetia bacterium]|nr:hypothetical protein [Spirochaetia bacterium]